MIICHKHKFIFIKTFKTAGTSIELYLSKFCSENDVVTPIYPHVEPHQERNFNGYWNPLSEIANASPNEKKLILWHWMKAKKFRNHSSAMNIKHRVPEHIWNNYYKFCVDRNPWDKTLSHYHMRRKRNDINMTFNQYLQKSKFCLNYPKYVDRRGNIMVDKVIKYEELKKQLTEVFSDLSIPFENSLGVRAKGSYREDRSPYQEVYSPSQRDCIAKAFSREISMHNYEF